MTKKTFLLLPDLLDARVGGEVLFANDEFFAPKENLIKPGNAVWLDDEYTERGKWMDGWETRRRRDPGYDWVILRLGLPGVLHGVVVDTSHFRGNYPESCSIDACVVPEDATLEDLLAPESESGIVWREILGLSMLEGNTKNHFAIADRARSTHIRLNIHPDGGVARLRAHGQVLADWPRIDSSGEAVNLVAIEHGGRALACSDECFGPASNLLMPGTARNIGDGWETRRRRGTGHDWVILQLGTRGVIDRALVDTSHFIGNAPGSCSLEWCDAPEDADALALHNADDGTWKPLLNDTPLQPDRVHAFESELESMSPATHIRFCIHPDGGVARLHLYGRSARSLRLAEGLVRLEEMDDASFRAEMLSCCGSTAWADGMVAARPFADIGHMTKRAHELWSSISQDDWREAFAAHPRIGASQPDGASSARNDADDSGGANRHPRWSVGEQSGVADTPDEIRAALAEANDRYYERFGYIYIVFASGKSAKQMLAILRRRMENPPDAEIAIAAAEQYKITHLRLQKLLLELAGAAADE